MADDYDTINNFYFTINIRKSASSQLPLTNDSCEEAVSYLQSPGACTQVTGIGHRVLT